MTPPDEVVKEIKALSVKWYGAGDGDPEVTRIALLTRRLTIEECAKVLDEEAYPTLAKCIRRLKEAK